MTPIQGSGSKPRYRTIVADPPWPYTSQPTLRQRASGIETFLPYRTMSLEDIAALPVKELSDHVGDDAHLYLWTTDQFLRDAFDIARGWGFHHVSTIVWCKDERGAGLGGAWPNNVEFVLFAKRPKLEYPRRPDALRVTLWLRDQLRACGLTRRELCERADCTEGQLVHWLAGTEKVQPLIPSWAEFERLRSVIEFGAEMDDEVRRLNARKGTERALSSAALSCTSGRWFQWPRGAHSDKPDAFLDLVEQVSPGPYVELFARRARFGWDYWGDQSLGTAEMAA